MPAMHARGRHRSGHTARLVASSALALLALLAVGLVALRLAAPGIAQRALVRSVRQKCPQCTIEVGPMHLAFFRGRASVDNVHFASDPHVRTRVSFRARRVELDARVWSVLHGPLHIARIALEQPTIEVRDDAALHGPPYDPTPALLGLPPARVDRVEVSGGTIVYANRAPDGREAVLAIRDVDGRIGAFGTRPGIAPRLVPLDATARLEGAGPTALHASVDPLSRAGDGTLALTLRDQPLAAFDRFLGPAMRIHAHGAIDHARATLAIRDGDANGQLRGAYHGFTVEADPTSHHGPIATIATDVVGNLEIRDVAGQDGRDAVVDLHAQRGPRQPYFEFLWRTLRDGGERIAVREPLRQVQHAQDGHQDAQHAAEGTGGGPSQQSTHEAQHGGGHHGFLGLHFGHHHGH